MSRSTKPAAEAPLPPPRLMLITPVLAETGDWPMRLAAAAQAGDVAAVLLRIADIPERDQINLIKQIAAPLQGEGVAVIAQADASVAVRGGADGVHVQGAAAVEAARETLKGDRSIGAGGLKARHDAMDAGEAGCDYVLFGEPRADGSLPAFAGVVERAQWWADIFEIPCAAYCPERDGVDALVATGCEFVALGPWAFESADSAALIAEISARLAARQPADG